MRKKSVWILFTAAALAAATGPPAPAQTTRVSLASDTAQGNDDSWGASISADGWLVAYSSNATNLVAGDTNGRCDVFVHDRLAGATSRVSIGADGSQGNGASHWPALSGDGRFVAFQSSASNLVAGDWNGVDDVFIHDRLAGSPFGATARISVAGNGSQPNGASGSPSISADGRFVAFDSYASNLVAKDTNGVSDVFLHDRIAGMTTRVSLASDGSQGNGYSYLPAISADGRFVAFYSSASNLVAGDTNGVGDVFVHDRRTGTTTRVSIADDGSEGNGYSYLPAISADGRFVAFQSYARNLVSGDTNRKIDVFVHDRLAATTTRVSIATGGSQGDDHSFFPAISADGRFVAFDSRAASLVAGDTNQVADVFIHDRFTGATMRASVALDGSEGNDYSVSPSLSADGRFVAFDSYATNLVPQDENEARDVFVTELLPAPPAGY